MKMFLKLKCLCTYIYNYRIVYNQTYNVSALKIDRYLLFRHQNSKEKILNANQALFEVSHMFQINHLPNP